MTEREELEALRKRCAALSRALRLADDAFAEWAVMCAGLHGLIPHRYDVAGETGKRWQAIVDSICRSDDLRPRVLEAFRLAAGDTPRVPMEGSASRDATQRSIDERARAVADYIRRERPKWIRSFQDTPLAVLRAALIVAECAVENDGAVDGATLQAFVAVRSHEGSARASGVPESDATAAIPCEMTLREDGARGEHDWQWVLGGARHCKKCFLYEPEPTAAELAALREVYEAGKIQSAGDRHSHTCGVWTAGKCTCGLHRLYDALRRAEELRK